MDANQLRHVSLPSDADDDELQKPGASAERLDFSERAESSREGDSSRVLLPIEEGTVEVTRGGEHIAKLGPWRCPPRGWRAQRRAAETRR